MRVVLGGSSHQEFPGGRLALLLAGALLWFVPAGCTDTGLLPGSCTPEDGNGNPNPALTSGKRVAGEPNDTYSEAIDVLLDDTGTGWIRGAICPSIDDVDIYSLGPMSPGDRIRVDLEGQGGLDAAIAIFDEGGRLFIESDDRGIADLDPFVNEVVRHAGINYYLAIASSPLGPSTGSYNAVVVVGRGEPVPPPKPQPVLLNFKGGVVTVPGDRAYSVGPFDAGDIDPAYTGQTAAVKQSIIQTVQENFRGIALQLYNSDTRPAPAGLAVSTVYFGGFNRLAYGISEQIDPYNHDSSDSSIIFTEDFAPRTFGRVLTSVELGRAIGNVASHEIGHLVGLNHVANIADLMDTTGGAETFLADQTFQTSLLDATIWPFGLQDGMLLLQETLGTAP